MIDCFNLVKFYNRAKPTQPTNNDKKNLKIPASKLLNLTKKQIKKLDPVNKKQVKELKMMAFAKKAPNIHKMTIKFLGRLAVKLQDKRGPQAIEKHIVDKCPTINVFTQLRTDVLNCQILTSKLPKETDVEKTLAIGCLKNVLQHLNPGCKAFKTTPIHNSIQRVIQNHIYL
jgi:hypothetical protein